MANITVSFVISDTQIDRLVDALSEKYGCAKTPAAVKAAVIADWKGETIGYENRKAQAALTPPSVITIN